jgi:hypothetical protein
MEQFGFLVKEKSCGYFLFRGSSNHMSDQSETVLPLLGWQILISLNFSKSLRISFHQKDPTGALLCGGVCSF